MTDEERMAKARGIFNDVEAMVISLYGRWLDERGYEALSEYGKPIKRRLEELGATFVRMTGKPFGFEYKLGEATYHVKIKNREYSYTRIA